MKSKAELQPIIDAIAHPESPVGMDAVYVHALILERLEALQTRLTELEAAVARLQRERETAGGESRG